MSFQDTTQNARWHPDDGWMGLVPGRSRVSEAATVLGAPQISAMFNGVCHDFRGGQIRISGIDPDPDTISKIWISKDLADQSWFPLNLEQAKTRFAPLKATAIGAMNEVIWEGYGVRLAATSESEQIIWMELFRPQE